MTEGIEITKGLVCVYLLIGMLTNPVNVAAKSEALITPSPFASEPNLISPATKAVMKMDNNSRFGTLKSMAKPIPTTPDQSIFSKIVISKFIIKDFEY